MEWKNRTTATIIKLCCIVIVLPILIFVYKVYSPYEFGFFPKCILKESTGLLCPGCGSQRSVHFLLNGDIHSAAKENVLLVFSLPYILIGFIFESLLNRNKKLAVFRRILFGQKAIYLILFLVFLFWTLRNIII